MNCRHLQKIPFLVDNKVMHRKFRRIILSLIFTIVFYLINPASVFAWFCPAAAGASVIPTALGDIPTDAVGLSQCVMDISVRIVGGIGILLLIFGAFTFMTSEGDPHKLQEATDIIFSAIAGMLVVLLSVIILRIIGYDVLMIF